MLVHRIKTTLLLDDFDVQKALFRSPEVNWHSSLKNFLSEQVIESSVRAAKCNRRRLYPQSSLQLIANSFAFVEKKYY